MILNAVFMKVQSFRLPLNNELWKVYDCFQKSAQINYLKYLESREEANN